MKEQRIPSGWQRRKQSEVASFYNGRAYKLSEWEKEGIPVIRLQNLTGSGNEFYFSNLKLPEHQYVKRGELLYMWSATFGPKIWDGEKAIYHYHIWKVKCNKNKLDQSFMYYNLGYITESMKTETNGSTMLHLTKKGMEEYLILVPPLQEQQKIAEILSTVDKKIDLIDQKITETQQLKTGLMQKLFSEGVGVQDKQGNWVPHTEFNKNRLPSSWIKSKLGNLAKISSGGTPSRQESIYWGNGNIPWITTSEVNFNKIYKSKQKITNQGMENSAAKLFPKGTVLIAMYGQGQTRGRVAILEIEASTNQACAAIICNQELIPSFCYYFLASQYEKVRCIGNEGSQKNLNGQIIKDLVIPCPNISEQQKIAEILSTVDQKLDLLSQQKAETQQLKKGLMQKLLTGEWRVPLDEMKS